MNISNSGGINIATMQAFKPQESMQQFNFKTPDSFSEGAQAKRTALIEAAHQENLANSQNTVIKRHGNVIMTIGDNGFQHFSKNSDAHLSPVGSSGEAVIQALQREYGSSLSVERYSPGQGPKYAEILEEIYGTKPGDPIDVSV